MSELHLEIRKSLPGALGQLTPAGQVMLKIDISDVAKASDRDLRFVTQVIDLMAAFVSPPPEVPAVLRGVASPSMTARGSGS